MSYSSYNDWINEVGNQEAPEKVEVLKDSIIDENNLFTYCLPHPGKDFTTKEAIDEFQKHYTGIYRNKRGGHPRRGKYGIPLNLSLEELERLYSDLPKLIERQKEREKQ